MSDLIKREDAIEAIKPILRDILTDNTNAFKAMCIPHILTGVPSADRPMLDDGTLVVTIADATAVTRVLVEDSEKNGDLYYNDRPKGEWRDTGKDKEHLHPLSARWYRCSVCGLETNAKTNYCFDCGADMRGEDNE